MTSIGTMSARAALLGCLAAAAPLAAPAWGEAAVGVRYGWLDAKGDLFEGSGDLGGGDLVGIQLDVVPTPWLGFELAGEYVDRDLEFTRAQLDEMTVRGSAAYENLTIYLTLRLYPISFVALPLKLYAGGGVHVNYADLEVEEAGDASFVPRSASPGIGDDIADAVAEIAGPRNRGGWHAIAGLKLAPRGFPFCFFVEGRHAEPFPLGSGDEADAESLPEHKSVYAGVSIRL